MEINAYGVMIAVGILASGLAAYFLSKRLQTSFYDWVVLAAYAVGFGFLGGKLAFVLVNIRSLPWQELGLLVVLQKSGFVFFGGLILAVPGVLLMAKLHRLDADPCLKICAALLPAAHGFGRIGCGLAGCCYGVPYSGPLAITYTCSASAPNGQALFPVQPLEAVMLFALSGVLLWMLLKGSGLGRMAQTYLLSYCTLRFLLEFLRGDAERGVFAGLATSQWISLLIAAGCLVYWAVSRRRNGSIQGTAASG